MDNNDLTVEEITVIREILFVALRHQKSAVNKSPVLKSLVKKFNIKI